MTNNLPKRPVRFQENNQELLKSMGADYSDIEGKTNYTHDTDVATLPPGIQPSYRTPHDRVNGNVMFRRYLNGTLDMDNACQKVIDAVNRYKEKDVPKYTQECIALQVIFPGHFDVGDVDPLMAASVAAVNLDLIPEEVALIRMKVATHLAEVMNWNAGQGGGSTPGRHQTYVP